MSIELDDDGLIRLQKLLAQSGVASRRKCEELMLDGPGRGRRRGRHPARHQGRPAHRGDPGRRQAAAADQPERLPGAQQAPGRGLDDVRPGGPADADRLVADRPERLFHVGRLDTDTSGLILLTNDGDFAHRMAHPSYEVDKTYVAEVEGEVTKATLQQLLRGRHARGRPGDGLARPGWSAPARATPRAARSSSWSSTRAATGSCAGCSTTSATRSAG